jgi:hypothetical protein
MNDALPRMAKVYLENVSRRASEGSLVAANDIHNVEPKRFRGRLSRRATLRHDPLMADDEPRLLPVCPAGCARGWILDADENEEVRCPDAECPYWEGAEPLAVDPRVHFDRVLASTAEAPVRTPMLKMPLRWTRDKRVGEG